MKIELRPESIARLKSTVVPGETRRIHWGSLPNIEDHMVHMRQDFAGLPELCVIHGQLIVLIRRRIDLMHHLQVFQSLWETETDFLIEHLTSRWLLSACDTFSAHGHGVRRATAAALSGLIHMLQVCETERLAMRDTSYDPAKYDAVIQTHRSKMHVELWDGIKADAFEHGDSARHMLTCVVSTVDTDPVIGPIGRALITRALASDTVLGRLRRINSYLVPPLLTGQPGSEPDPCLLGSVEGYNVVQIGTKFLAVPQSLGPLDLSREEDRARPGIIVTDSIPEAVAAIAAAHMDGA